MKKKLMPRSAVKRITWEPNYREMDWCERDEADRAGISVTPESHPDAFYRVIEPAWPVHSPAKPSRRRLTKLSRTQLRKVLSAAGYRRKSLHALVQLVSTPPALEYGLTLLGWPQQKLEAVVGKKAMRYLRKKAAPFLLVMDELCYFLSDTMAADAARQIGMAGQKFAIQERLLEQLKALHELGSAARSELLKEGANHE